MEVFRDSTAGHLVRRIKPSWLPYEDEREEFECPSRLAAAADDRTLVGSSPASNCPSSKGGLTPSSTLEVPKQELSSPESDADVEAARRQVVLNAEVVPTSTAAEESEKSHHALVDWYGPDDPENPQNWPYWKKVMTTGLICLLTFSVYIGSAIFTPSIPAIEEAFGVSTTYATMGLSMYVLAYGLGPMVLSPLSEIPSIGRNPVYMISLAIFVVLQFPTVWAPNKETLMAMRFWAGFVGSPALATGGASLADIWAPYMMPYAIIAWSVAAVGGPVVGPVIGGFAAQGAGWRWPLLELLWISAFAFLVLFFTLPETYAPTILYKRAQRLRRLTGHKALRSHSEIEQSQLTAGSILAEALWQPIKLMREPAVLYADVYIGLVYSQFYLFFESVPLVYTGIYKFNLGQSGLPFIAVLVGNWLAAVAYYLYLRYYDVPRMMRKYVPEDRLGPAFVGSFFIPVCLFMFGWTSRASVHWIVPTIALALYTPGIWLLFQGMMAYLPSSYPQYSASVLAGNDLVRSSMAAAFPIFGRALFVNLGIGPGCSLLAGLSILFIPPLYFLWRKGEKLRQRSAYATA